MNAQPPKATVRQGAIVLRFGLLTLTAVALLALVACTSQAKPSASAAASPEVSVARVLTKSVREWDEFTGRVSAVDTVELRPRVSGHIDRVAFAEGQEVRKGDLLFEIDPRRYRASLNQALADLERARSGAQLAQAQGRRAQTLIKAQVISREDYESRRAASAQGSASVRAAEAAVESARLDLQYAQVRAPISGRVGRALLTRGNLAQADATLLTTVVSVDPVHIYFEADEQTYLRYNQLERDGRGGAQSTVRIGLADETGYPHVGQLDFVDNQVNPQTGTIRARAVVTNADRRFTPGLFARVQLQGGTERTALLIDDRAVLTDQDRKYVYVLGPKNVAVRKDVTVGRLADGLRVVKHGLEPTDAVIVHGLQKVFAAGMSVAPSVVAMGAAPAPTAVHVN